MLSNNCLCLCTGVQYMLLFLALAVNSDRFRNFYVVKCSYSSRPFFALLLQHYKTAYSILFLDPQFVTSDVLSSHCRFVCGVFRSSLSLRITTKYTLEVSPGHRYVLCNPRTIHPQREDWLELVGRNLISNCIG